MFQQTVLYTSLTTFKPVPTYFDPHWRKPICWPRLSRFESELAPLVRRARPLVLPWFRFVLSLLEDSSSWVTDAHGPDPGRPFRALEKQSLELQTCTHISAGAHPPLIPRDVPPERHIDIASTLTHPFVTQASVVWDQCFAWKQALALLHQPPDFTPDLWKALSDLAADCNHINKWILTKTHDDIKIITGNCNVAFIMVLVKLLQWPNWSLPDRLVF